MSHYQIEPCGARVQRRFARVALGLVALVGAFGADAAAVFAQNVAVASHPWGLSPQAVRNNAALVLAGGGPLPEEIYEEFVRLAGGGQAWLVIIPSAHPFESLEDAERAYRGWHDMGARAVEFVHAEDSDEANEDDVVAPLRRATGAWIGGGAQGRLADLFVGTKVQDELKRLLDRGGVIGGTSAGASIMSETMIRHGHSRRAVLDQGLGFLPNVIIDQHFLRRGREPRLLRALSENPDQWGVGVDEGTALIVRGHSIRAMGRSQVMLYRSALDDRPAWSLELDPGGYRSLQRMLPP